jgi:hypothetical protein
MVNPRLSKKEVCMIHDWFKSKMVALCHEFNETYLFPKSPFYPQACYIQLAAMTELLDELKIQLKTPVGQKWKVLYTHPNGEKGMGLTSHYGMIPNMIEDLLRLNCREIVVTDETIYKEDDNDEEGRPGKYEILCGR